MPIAYISPKVREILKDSKKSRKMMEDFRKRKPDKNSHVKTKIT